MNKRNQIINLICQRGEGYKIDAREVWVLALECECCAQYVRSVRAELRASGALDADNCFVGRWVQPKELVDFIKAEDDLRVGLLMSDSRKAEMAKRFQTTPRKLFSALRWAISCLLIEERYSYYGWHVLAA